MLFIIVKCASRRYLAGRRPKVYSAVRCYWLRELLPLIKVDYWKSTVFEGVERANVYRGRGRSRFLPVGLIKVILFARASDDDSSYDPRDCSSNLNLYTARS
jgi:hypothetical protein